MGGDSQSCLFFATLIIVNFKFITILANKYKEHFDFIGIWIGIFRLKPDSGPDLTIRKKPDEDPVRGIL